MCVKAFQTSGPITDFDKTVYIERNEDKDILNDILRKQLVTTILGARQTGKTSLLYNIRRQLGEGDIPIYIDLSAGDSIKDEKEWYQRFICEQILYQIGDRFISNVEKQKISPVENKLEFLNFLNQVGSVVKSTDRIVMMLDEFGTVPEFLHDNFFGAIRNVAVDRAVGLEGYEKWIFVLSGATDPRELISIQRRNSPFNITPKIYLSDFDKERTRQVVENLKAHGLQLEKEEEIIDRIHEQTGGHPNLVQKICVNLIKLGEKAVLPDSVNKAVEQLITEGDDSICRSSEGLERDESTKQVVMQILKGKKNKFSRNDKVKVRLELLGVIKKGEDGNCVIRNKVYEKALRNYFKEEKPRRFSTIIKCIKNKITLTLFGLLACTLILSYLYIRSQSIVTAIALITSILAAIAAIIALWQSLKK